ncbi:MAG: tRNA dihydrouridine synthase DusB [Clostridia bacterium]|nr:tRNA dihydrouridine synthase DusB [Clostridia bacterium]
MLLGNLKLESPVVAAPMAGVSDKVFRRLAREYGAALTYTEMVSAKGLLYRNPRTLSLVDLAGEERVGVQLFGAEPAEVAEAAALVVERGAVLVDLNMGCPVPKVVKAGAGAALMRDPDRAAAIVRAVAEAVPVPVTVKMRKGWDAGEETALWLAREVAAAGAAAITVHGRTRADRYHGRADWEIIARVKEAVSVPVIGNGDLFQPEDAQRMMALTGCDAVMLARGVLGNPWLFAACRAVLAGEPPPPPPAGRTRVETALRHLEMMIGYYGEERGVLKMRKHLTWYLKGLPGAARLRQEVCSLKSAAALKKRLLGYACSLNGGLLQWP